jgi:uncharacterized protein
MKKNSHLNILILILINLLLIGCATKPSFITSPPSQTLEPANQIAYPTFKKIAVLLPLSGNLAGSGKAVRDGFLAAYYNSLQHGQPAISITLIDTNSGNIKELYLQSANQGAEFIVGALTKSDVENIATTQPLPVPTLVLNTLDHYPKKNISNLYQFGLSSRDEATQIAKKAWNNNLRRALIIVPNNARGHSLATILNNVWRYFGGTIKTTITYIDITSANQNIRTALNLDVNKEDLKHHTKFKPYEGNDIDVVFLIASPEQGRGVQPLIRFYINPNIPVYAISDIYSGIMHASLDADLDGITFCDMPWILQADKLQEPLLSLQKNLYHGSHERLYALGIDSYYLMLNLKLMSSNLNLGFRGATGLLSIDEHQHVYRTLNFARIHNGLPSLVN